MSTTQGESKHTSLRYKYAITRDEHGRVERRRGGNNNSNSNGNGNGNSSGGDGRGKGRKSLGGKRMSWVPNTYGESVLPHEDRSYNVKLGHTHENRHRSRVPVPTEPWPGQDVGPGSSSYGAQGT